MTNSYDTPQPDAAGVPLAPYPSGTEGQTLRVDSEGGERWEDTYPSGGDVGEFLESDGAGGAVWKGSVVHIVGSSSYGAVAPPYVTSFSESVFYLDANILLTGPSLAAWTVDFTAVGDLYDYSVYVGSPPVAGATVVAAAAVITMPALTILSPIEMLVTIQVAIAYPAIRFRVEGFARNAAGDVEVVTAFGTATMTGFDAPSQISIGGPMTATKTVAQVLGY